MPVAEIPTFEVGGLTLGGHGNPIQVSGFDPAGPDIRVQDAANGAGDGVLVGRDYFGGRSWSLEMYTDVEDYAEAMDLADAVATVWNNPEVRTRPGAVIPLRYRMAGRWRRVYGRPRGYEPPDGGLLSALGRAEFAGDFTVVDHLHYDDVEKSAESGTMPASTGGFILPSTFPLHFAERSPSLRSSQVRVGGTAPTWPTITITGPTSNPEVTVAGWSLRLLGHLPREESVTVNTAPWARTVTRGDGVGVPGVLHPATRLSGLSLPPGVHELRLEGLDATGTARATMTWRDAFNSL